MTPRIYTLHGLVEHWAARTPRAAAVRAGADVITYGELDAEATRLAAHLARLGVRAGDRVGLQQPKSLRAVAELVAILKLGAAYVPVDPAAPAERARFVFEHCGVGAIFAAGRPLQALVRDAVPLSAPLAVADATEVPATLAPRVEHVDAWGPAVEAPRRAVGDRELAYVLYTSGSTGAPKGVAITHAQSLAFVDAATEVFALSAADAVASHAPFNFDLSVIDLFCTFRAGATMVIVPEPWLAFPARIARLVAELGVTVWSSVPSAIVQLVTRGGLASLDLSRLRLVMFAGEPFPTKHLRTLRAILPHARILNVYGQTEANSSTYHDVDTVPDDDAAPLPVGRTFPGYDVLLLDDAGREVTDAGVEGELFVSGGAVASGYFGDPERTARAFVQHPLRGGVPHVVYRTGDRFARDTTGALVFRGRSDSAVKVRGVRVEPAELEAAATAHASVGEAAVVAIADEAAGHVLVLFVAGASEVFDEPALRAHVAARLPRYMLPEVVLAVQALPRTPNGKIDRNDLERAARTALGRP
ncbi:amino acid adenylation domain-containing protein [Myxococcota bacterium]|nr:amino acid adenylation domain-containing protein [Myxococcota bacterium]